MEKSKAIDTARDLYAVHGKRSRGGQFWRIRPTPERLKNGSSTWAVQIEIRRGIGGAALTAAMADFVAEDVLRIWKTHGVGCRVR